MTHYTDYIYITCLLILHAQIGACVHIRKKLAFRSKHLKDRLNMMTNFNLLSKSISKASNCFYEDGYVLFAPVLSSC